MSPVKTIRNHLTHPSVIGLLAVLLVGCFATGVLQSLGFEDLAYVVGVIPELAFIVLAIAEELTGIGFMNVSTLLPFGIVLLVTACYLVSVVVTVPLRAVYGAGRRLTA